MAIVTVKQPRVVNLDRAQEPNFYNYLDRKNLNVDNRCYILHLGTHLVSPVNENFVRLSVPYKRAASGYGVVILPKEQVMDANKATNFDEQPMYDVDLGDTASKLTVSYIDKDGNKCKKVESTRYLERYLNFTQSAYVAGAETLSSYKGCLMDFCNAYPSYMKNEDFKETYDFLMDCDSYFSCARNYASCYRAHDECEAEIVKKAFKYFEQYQTSDGFDYAACDKHYQEMSQKMKAYLLEKPDFLSLEYFAKYAENGERVVSVLNANAAGIYFNSFLDGMLDVHRKCVYGASVCYMMPEDASLSSSNKDYNVLRKYHRFCQGYISGDISGIHNELVRLKNSDRADISDAPNNGIDDYLMIPDIDDLPFQ